MPKMSLLPIRGEIGLSYDAAFFYLSSRGAVAERWAHEPGFGRHVIGVDSLRLTNAAASRVADVNLKNCLYMMSGQNLDWADFSATSPELLTDCLKTLQPGGVSRIYCDLKCCSSMDSFESTRDIIMSQLLRGQCKHPPDSTAAFEDVSVSLTFRKKDVHIHTTVGPMRRIELGPHLGAEAHLADYPEYLLFAERRYEIAAGPGPECRWSFEEAGDRLESFVKDDFPGAPRNVSEYVASILHLEEETLWP